ncbi:tRNA uridine 5-carboxymethylaminomethyl modification enzyme GidA [Mycoplasmopsis californica]|uniref:tRNA uridine 5-carboxymethylaminomethyl modification enzyme MnmG n=1 Tax=Mycoplasmopsis equigenitalium TaxID=114883 RepID=A0ABY5J1J7_9BACT|nr:tRNA uridine-5-carboxymethylaminomethyl(34) synthesis enzyme MnmG [Mycoplasmopsis equigenitalium]UUD37123.1 tRNA uridine-5-carboxymethylaminomethyl(34) synthesis enzyme MnmG [Mycoplasmopsis equigenitalium]VEU69571.1 tRNA uridine 5-carboxymethylaminomethyl modification enzyme GidA [Mycoplasmopsis californica]
MEKSQYSYDAVVIGAGHAGLEAAFALAKLGKKTALVTLDITRMGMMPCNPSIGGPAKGIITREIDALGGMQAYWADKTKIQIKLLNESKGPAVRALRAQIDKEKYSLAVANSAKKQKNLTVIEDMVVDILVKNNAVDALVLQSGKILKTKAIVVTTGTYMDARILRGNVVTISGPDNQKTTNLLSASLRKIGLDIQRLKTGTPPRIYSDSIDFSQVEKENLGNYEFTFSDNPDMKLDNQISCYLTYTTKKTHEIIMQNLDKSAMYSGLIRGIGPRYCPSIEDKIVKFADKDRHQIFFEPETDKQDVMYINGLSTSMPVEVQKEIIKTIPGLANARVQKWAYAIEYDAINPLNLKKSLETKKISNLFMAGQINGTSGYEEAAAQGLIAGINAARKLDCKEPIIIARNDGYIGVLIDDLTTKGTKEPYRMLTSRAEYRLLLRNDNADERLYKYAKEIKIKSAQKLNYIKAKYLKIQEKIKELQENFVSTKSEIAKKYDVKNAVSYLQLLARPEVDYLDILSDFEFPYEVMVNVRLKGYIDKQIKEAHKMQKLESIKIPEDINYDDVNNIAIEARMKLKEVMPMTIGQASRISGINPSDIQMLIYWLKLREGNSDN